MSRMQHRSVGIHRMFSQGWLPAVCLGALVLLGAPARGQIMNPAAIQGRENTESVFVRDSAIAVDKVFQAKHMEDLKEWARAAEVYQDIIKSYADRMIPSDVDRNNEIYQYGSVTPLVHEKLSHWPPEGLAAYRARYESEAQAMLESANDNPAILHRVMTWYFVTDAGKQSAIRLMDLYFERGEFSAVAWIGEKLVALHPFLNREKAQVLFRAALANHLAGEEERAQLQSRQLTEQFADVTATIRGEEMNLSQLLARELAGDETRLREFSFDSWPMAFGSKDRSRVPQVGTYGGAKLFSVEIEKPTLSGVRGGGGQRTLLDTLYTDNLNQGIMTGIIPVVDHGELFFQDNASVYALSAESGYPLPGWLQTYPGDRRGRYTVAGAWPTPRSYQSTLTVTEESVLAIMSQPDLVAANTTGNQAAAPKLTRLVCLDRRTGKERWVSMPARFPEPQASLRGLDLTGSPLVVGDLVYVQARGGKGLQFEDSYVMAFELASGQLKWTSYVASANSGQQFYRVGLGAIMGGSSSHLAYDNGRIYAQTNIGAVAALDAYDGTIVWLNIYPRDAESNRMFNIGWGRGGRRNINNRLEESVTQDAIQPWKNNPVIVSQGNVFVLPNDGSHVHIYDAGTGAEIKRVPTSTPAWSAAEVMLGVVEDKLILHNPRQVYCINWRNYTLAPDKQLEYLVWKSAPEVGSNDWNSQQIMGRGFVTADSVLVPMAGRLLRLSLTGGKIEQTYPGAGNWPENEGPGNVLVTQDRLIIAGPADSRSMRVNVYTDLDLAIAKLEREIAAAPNDPAQRLRFADIMFAAGKVDLAIAKLDEAMGLLNGPVARGTDARDRIFNSAMAYGQKLSRDPGAQNDELVAALYDRAGSAAGTPSQKVEYRLARARYAAVRSQFDVALRFFQQILQDPALRSVPVFTEDTNTISAGNLARSEIQRLIESAGVAIYAPYEQAANEALLAAARARDPQQLQNIGQAYPNSVAASRALLLAAEVFEASGDARMATQVLRQAYFERNTDRNPAERTRILEALARNYLRLPQGIDSAIARLGQAAALGGSSRLTRPLILPDGKMLDNLTLAQALDSLKQLRTQTAASALPDVGLPSSAQRVPGQRLATFQPENPTSVIPGVNRLIVPDLDFGRSDRIVTFTETTGIRVFAVGQNTPLMTSDVIARLPMGSGMGSAWSGGGLIVWTDAELVLLDPDAKQTSWATSLKTIAPIEVVSRGGPNDPRTGENDPLQPARNNLIPGGQRIVVQGGQVIIRGNQIQVVQIAQPQPNVPPRPANEQISQVYPLSDRVLVGTTDGRLIALNLADGKVLWQQRPGDMGFSHLVASEDFVAIRIPGETGNTSQLVVFDSYTGQAVTSPRVFGNSFGNMNPLVNIALAPDGTLLYLTEQVLFGKDLFEPGGLDRPTFQFGSVPREPVNFAGASSRDHLQVFGDKIVVVSRDNAGSAVYLLDLRDGSKVKFGASDAVRRLDRSSTQSPFLVRAHGSSLYLATAREVQKVDMETGASWGPVSPIVQTAAAVRDMVVARGHLILLTDLAGAQQRSFFVRLLAFSREPDPKGLESGLLEHNAGISTGNAMLSGWQVVDGGVYYLGGDARLHFLRGARD